MDEPFSPLDSNLSVRLRRLGDRLQLCVFVPEKHPVMQDAALASQLVYDDKDGCYLLPDSEQNRALLSALGADLSALPAAGAAMPEVPDADLWYRQAVEQFAEALRTKGYSASTIRLYVYNLRQYLDYIRPDRPNSENIEAVSSQVKSLMENRDLSLSFQNQLINAVKLYYELVLHRPLKSSVLARPGRLDVLPRVLSTTQIHSLLTAAVNLKHRLIIMLAYGAGLRPAEISELRVEDIDRKKGVIIVRSIGSRRRRLIPLPRRIADLYAQYTKDFEPTDYLFEGKKVATPITIRRLQQMVKSVAESAGLEEAVSMQVLRNSFATHLLEQGTDIHMVKELLGHDSIRTTQLYMHVARKMNPDSPLDRLLSDD
jgi:integrase/recombinase XerD